MFCVNCGEFIDGQANFCGRCGCRIDNHNHENRNSNVNTSETGMRVIYELCHKEKIGIYIWLVIVCCQFMIGFVFPSAWGFALWNIFSCYQNYQFCKNMVQTPVGIYKHYENELTADLIFIGLNLFLGGVVGVIGGGYALYVRKYAMDHRELLLSLENNYIQ